MFFLRLFRFYNVPNELKRKQQSFEIRKLTNYLRTEFGAEPTKITIDKKELRVWKFPKENLDRSEHNNCDPKGFGVGHEKMMKQREEENGGYRYKTGDHY